MHNFRNIFLPICGLFFSVVMYFSMNGWKYKSPEQPEIEKIVKETYGEEHSVINPTCEPEEQAKKMRCEYTLKIRQAEGETTEKPSWGYFWHKGDNWEGILY